jgi:hypothetical protein
MVPSWRYSADNTVQHLTSLILTSLLLIIAGSARASKYACKTLGALDPK